MSNHPFSTISRRAFVGGLSASLISCATPRRSWSKTTADVIVIGAGLSGLHAARLIEKAGWKVILLEGNNRTGGRLFTLRDLPGAPAAGGIQVGGNYKRFHKIAKELGIELYMPEAGDRASLYYVNGETTTASDWLHSPSNKLASKEKKIPPDRLFFSYLRNLPQFKPVSHWMNEEAGSIDIPLKEFLQRQGASDEALRLIDANLNGNSIATQSALHMARSLSIFRGAAGSGPTRFVRGGSDQITQAMAEALQSDILLNSRVAALEDEGDGVEISLADGRKFGARHVICTAPFSVLRSIRIEAELPLAMRQLISTLPYTRASFAYLTASEAFWKNDGLPETIWSDDPMLGRVFALNEGPPMLKVWLNGPSADLIDNMDDNAAGAAIIDKIETARPSARGKLKLARVFSWQKQPFARGIYHHIGAGQGAALAKASSYKGQRLHFAGEHLAQQSSGMEGALESGERAAKHVMQIL